MRQRFRINSGGRLGPAQQIRPLMHGCRSLAQLLLRSHVPGIDLHQRHIDDAPPRLEEFTLRPPRVAVPATLASFCSADPIDRLVHAYGKSFVDSVRVLFAREMEHALRKLLSSGKLASLQARARGRRRDR